MKFTVEELTTFIENKKSIENKEAEIKRKCFDILKEYLSLCEYQSKYLKPFII